MTYTLTDISDSKFSLNGYQMWKVFLPLKVSDTTIRIINVYDSKFHLVPNTNVGEFEVGGVTYATANALITALLDVLYYGDFGSGSGGGSLPSTTPGWEVIYFGAGAIPNSDPGNTPNNELVNHINDVGFTITAGKLAILNITVLRTINGSIYWVKETYIFKNNNTAGTWGNDSTNGPISFSDLDWRNSKTLQQVTGNEVVIDLGNIGANTVETAVNALDPTQDLLAGVDYFFNCVRNGNQETYLYTGSLPTTVGTGETDTESTDFDLQNWSGATGTIALDPAAVKTAYESNDDTNAFTDDEKAKLTALRSRSVGAFTDASGTINFDLSTNVRKDYNLTGDGTITPINLVKDADTNGVNVKLNGYNLDFGIASGTIEAMDTSETDWSTAAEVHVIIEVMDTTPASELVRYSVAITKSV